jgi:hypothetical protein
MAKPVFIKIQYLGEHETVVFAAKELKRYLQKIDPSAEIVLIRRNVYVPATENNPEDSLWIGVDPAFHDKLPVVKNPELDDGVYIRVKNNTGIITGTNERSVLLGVYRFLRELGCAWVFPGEKGERIPAGRFITTDVSIREAASYRHRGVCIEGAVSCDHVLRMIDWLPKAGMNTYHNEFQVPYTYFDNWYTHIGNPGLAVERVSVDEVAGMVQDHIGEIKKRGIFYQAVGHSWTCDPFGIEGNGWYVRESVPKEAAPYLAQIKGVRELFGGIPLNTNLCYGNPEVRERITDAIAAYCIHNPAVDIVHFWLADNYNNHCECELCKDTIPSDFYIMMINQLDEKLISAGVNTRIVFLVYMDLLWEPLTQVLKNPERFILLFAPISRTYSASYADAGSYTGDLEPYVRNQITLPRNISTNLARLRKWQEKFPDCDSFAYEYHFMWDHYRDPGYMDIARVLLRDINYLQKLNINGMVNNQTLRAFFPTGFGMALMGEALWNKDTVFETAAAAYFNAAYGDDGSLVFGYLDKLTRLFDPPYLRHEKPQIDPAKAKDFSTIEEVLDGFRSVVEDNMREEKNPDAGVRYSWKLLQFHGTLCGILSKALGYKAADNGISAEVMLQDLLAFVRLHEMEFHEVLDVFLYSKTISAAVLEDEVKFGT